MLYSETNLVKSFGRSIVSKSVDPFLNIEETSVDTLFEDLVLIEKIPVLKDIFAVGKTVSISDKFFCKRLVAFIQEFNNGNISQYKMDKHIDKLKEEKKLDPEYEQVIVYIEQCSQTLQAKYLARFYQSYWNGDYEWDTFREIAEANQKMFTCDYEVLQSIAGDASATGKDSSMSRLVSLGLIVDRRSAGEGVSLTGFGIEFAKGLDAKKKPARKSASGAKKPSINEDLFSSRLQTKDSVEKPEPVATDPAMFKDMDIDEAFALLAAAPSPFKPIDSASAEPEAIKAKPDSESRFGAAATEAKTETSFSAKSEPAFSEKAEPAAAVSKPEPAAPKARPGTSSRSKSETSTKSKSTPKPAFDPKDTSTMGVKQLRPIINTDNDSPYASSPMASDGSSPFKPAPAPKSSKTSKAAAKASENSPFKPAAVPESEPVKEPAANIFRPITASEVQKPAEPSPFKPAPSKKAAAEPEKEPAAEPAVYNPFRAAANSESKKPADSSPFKPAPKSEPVASKSSEPSPFKPAAAPKSEPAASKTTDPSPFRPIGAPRTEAPASQASDSPFKPAPAAKVKPAAPKSSEPSPFKPAAAKSESAASKITDPSPFRPIAAAEAPKPAEPSPFKPLGATNNDAPASEANNSPFKPFGNVNQDPPVHIEGANPHMFNMGSYSNPNAEPAKGTSKLGSFMSMDDDEVLHQDKETGKLGSYMSMDDDEDTGEKLPQRAESTTNYFAMSSASSAPSPLSSSDSSPFKPMKPANAGGSNGNANPSPFRPIAPSKPDSDSPLANPNPSPFKPLGS